MSRDPSAEVAPTFELQLPHGLCLAVEIPDGMTDQLAAALHPEERRHLAGLPPARQPSFAAGRAALHRALIRSGLPDGPLLPGPRGAPTLPPGALGSISHKRDLAVALAAAAAAPGLPPMGVGVDLENRRRLRVDISRRVLTSDERARWSVLPDGEARDHDLITSFSLKESFYKAVNGLLGTSVSFHQVAIDQIDQQGRATFSGLLLQQHPLDSEGWVTSPASGLILSTARASLAGAQ